MSSTMNPSAENRRAVAKWLLACCALVFLMVILGGVTRLTGSGLSMVDWRPVTGALPPLSAEDWQRTFDMYRETPEFQKKNAYMDVDDFKGIFWLEYLHRLLGRLIGIVFFVPFVIFLWRGYIRKSEWPKYAAMFALGGFQGVLGWYMVKSGLVDNPAVSQYRLTAHLMSAFLIYGFMLWVALSLRNPPDQRERHPWFAGTVALGTLVVVTIVSGGFVAGLKAGKIYNTFPKMGQYWIPPDAMALEPWWRNLFDNMGMVQFNHRVLAITTFVAILVFAIRLLRTGPARRTAKAAKALMHTAVLQVALGVSTLLLVVPLPLAAAHQAVGMLLFTTVLLLLHSMHGMRSPG